MAALALLGGTAAHAQKRVAPSDSRISYCGRINATNPHCYHFNYPGTHFSVGFKGSGLAMIVNPGCGYFEIAVDGGEPRKVYASKPAKGAVPTLQDSLVTLASGLGKGSHTASVTLVTEGWRFKPEMHGLLLDKGARLLAAPKKPGLKLEFIGNSITCGYGVEAESGKDKFHYATENHYFSYAAITARNLKADWIAVARSGIGVYRNAHDVREGSRDNMRRWYDYTQLYDSTQLWDFASYRPDVICVNLGTNDLKTQPHDVNLFREAYMQFARHLHSVQPQAKLVLLTGTMLKGDALNECTTVLDSVARVLRAEGVSVYRFDMTPIDGSLGWGANWHPSMRQHQLMAQELTAFLRREVLAKAGK